MFITLGKLNKKMIFFVILHVFNLTNEIYFKYINNNRSYFISTSLYFLSLTFNGIFWLVKSHSLKFINKKNIDKELISNNDTKLPEFQKIILKEQKELNKKKWNKIKLFIFVVSYCIISKCFNIYIKSSEHYRNRIGGIIVICYFLEIISLFLFSYLFIKIIRIYKHHYVALIIIILTLNIINASSYFRNEFHDLKKEKSKIFMIMLLISNITTSLEYVLGGLYLNKTEGNIFKLCFFIGIFGFLFLIIIQNIFRFSSLNYEDIFDNFNEENKKKNIIYFLEFLVNFDLKDLLLFLKMIINCILYYSQWYIIYNFSPNHLGAIESISNLLLVLLNNNGGVNPFYIIGSIIIIFMVFVFNEFIILRFCGLEKNTKIEIDKRAAEEESIYNIDSILDEDFNKEKNNEVDLEIIRNSNINQEN